jgi:hypothetical protein
VTPLGSFVDGFSLDSEFGLDFDGTNDILLDTLASLLDLIKELYCMKLAKIHW